MNDKCSRESCANPVKRKDKKYCSIQCYNLAKSVWSSIKCQFCEKEFEGVTGKSKFCSKACSNSGTKRRRAKLTCEHCNKDFEVVANRKESARFCSYECFIGDVRDGQGAIVELKCEACGIAFQKPFTKRMRRFCSYSCANSGINNGMFGKVGELSSTYGQVPWTFGKTKSTDERVAKMGRKVSKAISDKIVAGEWNHQHGFASGHFTSQKSGRVMFYRSSYELKALEILDRDQHVKDFRTEPFSIEYKGLDGLQHRYHPDILVEMIDGTEKLIEVKPSSLITMKANQLKESAGQKFCEKNNLIFETWSESNLSI